jgi:hypothetical protein
MNSFTLEVTLWPPASQPVRSGFEIILGLMTETLHISRWAGGRGSAVLTRKQKCLFLAQDVATFFVSVTIHSSSYNNGEGVTLN